MARILNVTAARVRAAVRGGLCRPTRRGRLWQFSFQDLVVLRAANALLRARIPPRRIRDSMAALRRQIAKRPLSGVRVYADGDRVVARQGRTAWQPETGQLLFVFAVDDLVGAARRLVLPRRPPRNETADPGARSVGNPQAVAHFERALRLEHRGKLADACAAYTRAVELDPRLPDAYINLGRIVHERGRFEDAARLYRRALDFAPDDSIAHYDLALAYEDLNDPSGAVKHYRRALKIDSAFADAHFNLAALLERLGRQAEASRHRSAYDRLMGEE